MRMPRTCFLALIIILVGTLLIGCDPVFEIQYPFQYARTDVEVIEICSQNDKTKECVVLKTLSESEIDSIWTDISETICWDWLGPEWYESEISYGDVFIRIIYQNGDQELLGSEDVVRISLNGKELKGRYFFIPEDIYEMVSKYVDPEMLKDLNTYYIIKYREEPPDDTLPALLAHKATEGTTP